MQGAVCFVSHRIQRIIPSEVDLHMCAQFLLTCKKEFNALKGGLQNQVICNKDLNR